MADIIRSYRGTLENTIIVIVVAILVISCSNSRMSKIDEKGPSYSANIAISAGDDIDHIHKDTLEFMTYPMNVGIYKNNRKQERLVYIIGKRLSRGSKVGFEPVGLINVIGSDGSTEKRVIARPFDLEKATAKMSNYLELISAHYGVQQVLEAWIKNEKGYGSVNEIQWQDEEKAKEYLDQSVISE